MSEPNTDHHTNIGAMRAWPRKVIVHKYPLSSGRQRVYDERRCYKGRVVAVGAVGHSECGGCGKRVDQGDQWCRHCGARLVWGGGDR